VEVDSTPPAKQASPEELTAIQKTVEKRIKQRQGFVIHLVSFGIINILFWLLWGNDGWPIFISFFWGLGLISHGVTTFADASTGSKWYQREMERELTKRGYDPSLATQITQGEPKRRTQDKGDMRGMRDSMAFHDKVAQKIENDALNAMRRVHATREMLEMLGIPDDDEQNDEDGEHSSKGGHKAAKRSKR
jgi:hypothetical protein